MPIHSYSQIQVPNLSLEMEATNEREERNHLAAQPTNNHFRSYLASNERLHLVKMNNWLELHGHSDFMEDNALRHIFKPSY